MNWDDFSSVSKKEKWKKWKELDIDVIIHVFPNKKIAQLAKKAKTKIRVGTSHRLYHFWTCNKRVSFTRKKSDLHESQLNYELLRALGLKEIPSLNAIIKTTKLLGTLLLLIFQESFEFKFIKLLIIFEITWINKRKAKIKIANFNKKIIVSPPASLDTSFICQDL